MIEQEHNKAHVVILKITSIMIQWILVRMRSCSIRREEQGRVHSTNGV